MRTIPKEVCELQINISTFNSEAATAESSYEKTVVEGTQADFSQECQTGGVVKEINENLIDKILLELSN